MSSPGSNIGREERQLVWFSEIQWDFLSTRKQRLLSRFPGHWRILFIEPFALGRPNHWLPVRRGRVWVVGIPFPKNGPRWFAILLEQPFMRLAAELPGHVLLLLWTLLLGFRAKGRLIGLSNPYWGRIASRLPARLRFYDANDDHLAFPGVPGWLGGYLCQWLDASNLVFTVDEGLRLRLSLPPSLRTVELGNGVDYGHFSRGGGRTPDVLRGPGGPVLGYAGAMDWIDTGLVGAVAEAYPECRVVLVGPAYEHGWWERQEKLRCLPNVHYAGKVAYGELPAWVRAFDLALMPIAPGRLKGVSHPNKLYEYAAAGVPVLALNYCRAVDRSREVVMVASSAAEFVRMVPMALVDGRVEERRRFAMANDWDRLAEAMLSSLEESIVESRR